MALTVQQEQQELKKMECSQECCVPATIMSTNYPNITPGGMGCEREGKREREINTG
jgi:hypothetical protein